MLSRISNLDIPCQVQSVYEKDELVTGLLNLIGDDEGTIPEKQPA